MTAAQRQHPLQIEKRQGQYRFSILLIDDMPRIGLESLYRITIYPMKEIDMNRFVNQSLAALAAFTLALGSIGAIVTVPPAEAAAPAALALPNIA
jgi:hypothetical protein